MDRRHFLALAGTTAVVAATSPLWLPRASEEELEEKLLKEFINPSDNSLSLNDVQSIQRDLYIQTEKNGNLVGIPVARAFEIGDGYFITNDHAVDENLDELRINQPFFKLLNDQIEKAVKGGKSLSENIFNQGYGTGERLQVLHTDEDNDLALVRAIGNDLTGTAKIHLGTEVPKVGDSVSFFEGNIPNLSKNSEVESLTGIDFYDGQDKISLGSLTWHTEANLIEHQGFVQPYHSDKFKKLYGDSISEHSVFSSMKTANGFSGSPVFRSNWDNRYKLTGVVSKGVQIPNPVEVRNSVFGNDYYQNGAVFADRNAIEGLITGYLESKKGIQSNRNI
ncbi:trypsin-like peptidase domain-containing protein [Candidatus Woesearchaeota archaeon]|nr:trypsin-like peptidase domain-containing protein [Candidatus Woesearchaeota archaeon]